MIIRNNIILILLLSLNNSAALTTLSGKASRRLLSSATRRFLSDQWGDEDAPEVTSYDDASFGLIKEKEDEEQAERSEVALSGSDAEGQKRLRESVRARTSSLGIDAASQEKLKEYEERARARAASGSLDPKLDLSKISEGIENLAINFDPEDQLSEEEKREADELGFKPFYEQMLYELGQSTFPDPFNVVLKIILILFLGASTAFTIIKTDSSVMDFYIAQGLLPSSQDVTDAQNKGLEMAQELTKTRSNPGNLDLPDLSP